MSAREFIEVERYELREELPYRFELDRREFVAVLGAGVLVSIATPLATAQERGRRGFRGGRGRRGVDNVADRVHIGADGVFTVLTGKVEVGQGSRTQITMAAAEELGVPVDRVKLVMADSLVVPDDGGTSGSRTTPSTVPRVRSACAAARDLLLDAAAEELKVDRSTLDIRDAAIVSSASNESRVAFSTLVERRFASGLRRQVTGGVKVSAVAEWSTLGSSVPRVNADQIVTGAHRYPSDIVRPGMLYGAILRPPSFGATLEEVDPGPARALDGVRALRDGDFAGVAAPTSRLARAAVRSMAETARWREVTSNDTPSSETLYEYLKKHAREGGGRRGRGGRQRGSIDDGLESAKSVLRQSYHVAYVQHAPMEPRAAVAEWNGDALTVWTGTQNPGRVRSQLAEAFRVAVDKVRVVVPDTGGAFGGKHTGEVAIEAARLARGAKKPVSLRWTREEEFTWAYFRPAGLLELAGGVSADGKLTAWEHANYNSGGSALDTPYDIPNVRTRFLGSDAPLRQGSYRALASTANVFARESFMDELASAAGVDPLEFRRRHLREGRLLAVLEKAAASFRWSERRSKLANSQKRTRGIGISCGTEKGSYTAACAEVEIFPKEGRYRVTEVHQAFECGAIHNPANLRAQVEGCLLQGLGAVLREEIRFEKGRVLNPRFSRYDVPRFADVPAIEIALIDRRDLPSVGGSETPIIAVAPAVANALFDVTSERIRSLPLKSAAWRGI